MKLIIKTKSVEIEYQDDYSMIERDTKDRLLDVLKAVYQFEETSNQPVYLDKSPEKQIKE